MPADDECTSCNQKLSPEYALCSVNKCKLHFNCAGILEATWRKTNKQTWKCHECRKTKTASEPVSADEMRAFMSMVTNQLNGLEEVKQLIPLVKKLEESVQFLSDKYDEVSVKLVDMEEKLNSSNVELQSILKEIAHKDKIIEDLQQRMVNSEQYARNRNIEITNVEQLPKEDLHQIMFNIAADIGVCLNPGDIDIMHRVPTKSRGAPPKIIVQFTTRKIREHWLEKRNQSISLKTIVPNATVDKTVYINRHLAEHWRTLLWEAKQAGRPKGYQLIWFRDNKILAKKNADDGNLVYIYTKNDLSKLV